MKHIFGLILVLAVWWFLMLHKWPKSNTLPENDGDRTTSLPNNRSQETVGHGAYHVTTTGYSDADWTLTIWATLCVLTTGMFLALYWCKHYHFCRIVRYTKQMALQVIVLFYVTLFYDPSKDNKDQQDLDDESINPRRKVKVKAKQAQTDGPLHKRIKDKVNKVFNMADTYRTTTNEQQRRFRRTISKYHTKEQNMLENAERIDHELQSTSCAALNVKRKIVFLFNYMNTLRQKIRSCRTDNEQLLSSFTSLRTELRTADETISRNNKDAEL